MDDGAITRAGQHLRLEIEATSDHFTDAAWSGLDDTAFAQMSNTLAGISHHPITAATVPFPNGSGVAREDPWR
jgi:hypothetical protein